MIIADETDAAALAKWRSYANIARMLDELSTVPGVEGAMLTFDDFVTGMEQFGTRIQPLMRCREKIALAAE